MVCKKNSGRTVAVIFFLLSLLLLTAVFTPYLCNRYLLPQLSAQLPFSQKSLKIESISPWKLTATLKVGAEGSSVSLPRVEIDYSVPGLLRGEVEKVVMDGLAVSLQTNNGRPVFPPLSSEKKEQGERRDAGGRTVRIEKILLRDAAIHLSDSVADLQTTLLADGELSSLTLPFSDMQEKLTGSISLRGGLRAALDVAVDFSGKKRDLHLALTVLPGNSFRSCSGRSFQLSGAGTVKADMAFDKAYRLQHYSILLQLAAARFRSEGIELVSRQEKPVAARVEGDADHASFSLKNLYSVAPARLAADITGDIYFPAMGMQGRALLNTEYSAAPMIYNFRIQQEGGASHIVTRLNGEKLQIENILLPQLAMEAAATIKGGKTRGEISLDLPEIILPQLRISGVKLSLPLQFPLQGGESGKFSLASIRYRKRALGRVSGRLRQSAAGLDIDLRATSPFLAGSGLDCRGTFSATPLQGNAECHLPWAAFSSASLPALSAPDPSLSFSGKIGAKGRVTVSGGKVTGSARLAIRDGALSQEKISLTGIHGTITLPDINHIRSRPNQRLAIATISSGNIRAEQAEIRWQLEDPGTVFIEKAQLNWCGGRVEAASLRLSADSKELATTLYCDRLLLHQLLAQFDLAQTEGEASLNGRLPIVVNRQGVEIDGGFLFSTPGEKGVLSFADTRQIRDSIPGIATSPYIQYSFESLKNFAYNWIKLTFNSDKGDMLVKMQLDGKPAAPLPYRYNNGRIVPLAAGESGQSGLQHPVRFDVNFHLPLQQIFRYGTGLQSVINNVKESF